MLPTCNRLKHNSYSDAHAWNQAGIGVSDNDLPMILLVENFVVSRLAISFSWTRACKSAVEFSEGVGHTRPSAPLTPTGAWKNVCCVWMPFRAGRISKRIGNENPRLIGLLAVSGIVRSCRAISHPQIALAAHHAASQTRHHTTRAPPPTRSRAAPCSSSAASHQR